MAMGGFAGQQGGRQADTAGNVRARDPPPWAPSAGSLQTRQVVSPEGTLLLLPLPLPLQPQPTQSLRTSGRRISAAALAVMSPHIT